MEKPNQTKLFPLKSVSDVLLSQMQSVVLTPINFLGFRVSKIVRMCEKIIPAFSNGKTKPNFFPLKSVLDVLLSLMQSVVLTPTKFFRFRVSKIVRMCDKRSAAFSNGKTKPNFFL